MNVSKAKRNIPKDIKSLKLKLFFISTTSIPCRIEVNHPATRLPVAKCYYKYYTINLNGTQVRKIKEAGGLVILAHPGECSLTDEVAEELLNELMLQGLDGVECIHPSHSKEYAEKVMSWAKDKGLLMTGGSDSHGAGTALGYGGDGMKIPESFYDNLLHRKMIN